MSFINFRYFFDLNTPSMRKVDDGGKKRTVEIGDTTIVASRPPNGKQLQCR